MVCRKDNNVFLANVMFLIFIFISFTSFRNPCLHDQLHHKPRYVVDIAIVMTDSISGFDFFKVYLLIYLNNFSSLYLPQRVMYHSLIRPFSGSIYLLAFIERLLLGTK